MKRAFSGWVVGLAALLVSAGTADAAFFFQNGWLDGYTGGRDTFIQSKTGDQHKDEGMSNELKIRNKVGELEYILVFFDISSLPAGLNITSADLKLEKKSGGGGNPFTVTAYRLTSGPWFEGDGEDKTAGHSDWAHRIHDSTTWAGGAFGPDDYDPTGVSVTVGADGVYTWAVKDIVTDWYTGAQPNYGFVLIASGGTGGSADDERKFYSNQEGTQSRHPSLTVRNPVPAPGTLLLLGLGLGLMATMRARRRRG